MSLSKLNLSEIEHPVNKTTESYSSTANHSGFSLNASANGEISESIAQSSVPMQENTCACEEESIIAVEDDDDEEKSILQKDIGDEKTLSYSKSSTQMNNGNANITLKQNNKKRVDKCRKQSGKNVENDFSVTQNSNYNTHPVDESIHKSTSISTKVGKKEKGNEHKTVEILPANGDVEMQNEDKVSDDETTSITVNENGSTQAKEFCYASEIIANVCEDNDLLFQEDSALFQHPLLELGRRLWTSTAQEQHYTKGCLWSPDGTCLLLPVNLDGNGRINIIAKHYCNCTFFFLKACIF